jgi:hypothetical protein
MSARLRHLAKCLVIGTLFVSVGGHFALLQTLAWGNMLISYSRDASFAEAARRTFDGEHPCEMCKLVKKSRENEERKPLVKAEAKLDVVLPVVVRLKDPIAIDMSILLPPYERDLRDYRGPVPHPPPRQG